MTTATAPMDQQCSTDRLTAGHPVLIPQWVLGLLGLLVATSFFVQIEPAPTDLLFVLMCGLLLCTGRLVIPVTLGKLCWLGIVLFLVGDLISLTQVRFDLPGALKFWSITTYMQLSFVVFAGLLAWGGSRALTVVLRAYYVATVIAGGLAILALMNLLPFSHYLYRSDYEMRLCSTFKDSNVMAPFLVPGCLLAVFNLLNSKRRRWLHASALAVLFGSIVLAFSRAGWLNLMVALTGFVVIRGLLSRDISYNVNIVIAGLLICFAGTIVGWILLESFDRMDYLSQRLSLQNYDSRRFRNYGNALNQFAQHPLGIGPAQAKFLFTKQIHSLYFGVICESGCVAFTGFVLLIFATLHRAFMNIFRGLANRDIHTLIFVCIIGLLLNSLVVNSIHWRHLFLLLALPWGVYHTPISYIPLGVSRRGFTAL